MWWPLRKRHTDLDREIRGRLDLEKQERIDSGYAPEEAQFAARKAFGRAAHIDPMVALRYE
ncbi:MAG: permease prefix domain 1-containing protein [Bryobacteraceae bacterium]